MRPNNQEVFSGRNGRLQSTYNFSIMEPARAVHHVFTGHNSCSARHALSLMFVPLVTNIAEKLQRSEDKLAEIRKQLEAK